MGRSIRIRSLLSLTPFKIGSSRSSKGRSPSLSKSHFYLRALSRPDADSTDPRDFHIRSKKALLLASRFPYGEGQLRIKSLQEMVLRLKQEDRTFTRLFFELAISVCCFCQREGFFFFLFLSEIASEMKNVGKFNLSRMILTVYIMFFPCAYAFASCLTVSLIMLPLLNEKYQHL